MSRFFPRDVIHWGEERLHPLRAFAIRTVEPAGITGLVVRLWRAALLGSANWMFFVGGLVGGVLVLCGMLTWHLGNFPVRRWPPRVALFLVIELFAEMGTSSLLIAFSRERVGSRVATWADWWPMAGQTLLERTVVLTLFALVLAGCVQLVRRALESRDVHAPGA
ncbi:MAG: hypothetical protein P3B76_12095 [Gemmatimonadota bacterium]|jgi:hypothetical protein|nr:hypothetical protein [Gemmatimonadota bacterium]MDQ8168958.1 hypothetical protein [Gemmatimonadota bacterium]MDQ8173415.1 hypothetical protein [Gemmatimonadota bacterium]